ncbi:hypothetical protein H2248_001422 [Termitomyces sp. 'cryptogamus']|nr:hypothetical protein H2248_001422 [Termitomyces sp. 'cryptogamus']
MVLQDDWTEIERKYSTFPDDESRMGFIRERRECLAKVEKHADLCMEWAAGQTQDRHLQLKQLRTDRLNAIIVKLIVLGYEEDIASIKGCYPFSGSLANHELVKKPQKLTELSEL